MFDEHSTLVAPRRGILWCALMFSVLAVGSTCAALFVRFDTTVSAQGYTRATQDSRVVTSNFEATVRSIHVQAWSDVHAGDVVVVLQSTALDARRRIAESELALLRRRRSEFADRDRPWYARKHERIQEQIQLTDERIAIIGRSERSKEERCAAVASALPGGVTTVGDLDRCNDELRSLKLLHLSFEHDRTQQRLDLDKSRSEASDRERELDTQEFTAQSRFDAATEELSELVVRAPVPGRIESVPIHTGDPVFRGTPIAHLTNTTDVVEVVASIADADRAHVEVGALATIAIDQLPLVEFGRVRGRVVAVATEPTVPPGAVVDHEPRTHLGRGMYEVHVRIEESDAIRLRAALRPRAGATVRIVTRSTSLIELARDAIRNVQR